ncbi:hypothetical protein R1flu_001931 [Riccia fluitans]|uniref:Uncharacterized protein n=1 Tax=Riccia fluitans TaxID=41844 RepID=A0ABD1Y4N3_9MARC
MFASIGQHLPALANASPASAKESPALANASLASAKESPALAKLGQHWQKFASTGKGTPAVAITSPTSARESPALAKLRQFWRSDRYLVQFNSIYILKCKLCNTYRFIHIRLLAPPLKASSSLAKASPPLAKNRHHWRAFATTGQISIYGLPMEMNFCQCWRTFATTSQISIDGLPIGANFCQCKRSFANAGEDKCLIKTQPRTAAESQGLTTWGLDLPS